MSGYRMKDIAGYEGRYAITDDGRVWSYPKQSRNNLKGKWLKISYSGRYPKVGLFDADLKCTHKNVHRLIAEAFIENPKNLPEVNHINGDKTDYRIENLEWVSKSQNQKHKWENGLAVVTDEMRRSAAKNIKIANTKRRRFIHAEVKTIRAMVGSGNFSANQTAKCFNVSNGTINDIVHRKSYKEVV